MPAPTYRTIACFIFLMNVLHFQRCASMQATCDTKLSDLKHSIAKVICPGGCWMQHSDLCGSDDYARGPLCLAAMHAGLIDKEGGYFEVFKSDPLPKYEGTKSYGVTSKSCFSASFTYSFQMKCSTKGNSEFSVTDVDCPSGCRSNYVCGTNLYNSNSSVCAAAIHAGVLKENGGTITFYSHGGQSSSKGSTKNGVSTQPCDTFLKSFSFTRSNDCFRSCQNEGKCLSGINAEFCSCASGTEGKDCAIDINECTSGTHNCHQYATCINTVGSFQCSCNANYTGDGVECEANFCSANVGLCKHNGTCSDNTTAYSCSCDLWHTGERCGQEKDHVIMTTARNWTDARKYCQSIGGDLATWGMRNATVRNWIVTNLLQTQPAADYWVGLDDIEHEGVWNYIDGFPVTENNTDFNTGEPNNIGGPGLYNADCGHLNQIYTYKMDDHDCQRNQSAICERF
uniref:C-type lectin domain family 4 member F-like n=1 Tax=Phallusia mammillata TaxID=59560 RepID=A0A6F9D9C0_9ASCI|nr:C-type lectin domain family 4 member F-like [Phallusia mammillata]